MRTIVREIEPADRKRPGAQGKQSGAMWLGSLRAREALSLLSGAILNCLPLVEAIATAEPNFAPRSGPTSLESRPMPGAVS